MLSGRTDSEHLSPGDERTLLQLATAGDMDAFTQLYVHFYPRLYRFLFFINRQHEDTEEIVQDVFLKVWDRRESLGTVRSLEDYLFRMAKNRMTDLLRRNKTGMKVIRNLQQKDLPLDSPTESAVAYREYHRLAREAITQLPERRRQVFLLSTDGGLSLDEIAATLGISRSAVKKHLGLATTQVKAYLRQHAEWTAGMLALIFLSR